MKLGITLALLRELMRAGTEMARNQPDFLKCV
jgi:hypothetical protein